MQELDICGNPTEAATVQAWQVLLSDHFDIEREVNGKHCFQQKNVRVDMLLHPKFEWHGGGHFPIAFEIKKPGGNQYKALAQAADYAQCRWFSSRYADPIQTYVAINAPKFEEPQIDFSPPHFLGSFGVMLLQFYQTRSGGYLLSLHLSSTSMWTDKFGATKTNWSAQRKFGSR
jgi:hypothetical protein